MKRFHQVLQGLHDWLEAVVSRLSFTDVVHSDETSSTCFRAITSSIGAACGALSDEAGSTGDSSRSEVMSSDEDVGGKSEDLSNCEWSGRKQSGSGSNVKSSAGSAVLETGSATGVRVARGHC